MDAATAPVPHPRAELSELVLARGDGRITREEFVSRLDQVHDRTDSLIRELVTRDGFTLRYSGRGSLAHICEPDTCISECGRPALFGTGSQHEYARAASLPVCGPCRAAVYPRLPR
jgi:hypothetical protein